MRVFRLQKGLMILPIVLTGCSLSTQPESDQRASYAPTAILGHANDNTGKSEEGSIVSDQPSKSGVVDVPIIPRPLTLDAALNLAKRFNLTLAAKRRELDIAQGELKQASIYFQHNPEVSFGIGGKVITAPEEHKTFAEPGIELSQEFEIWGQPNARRKAAEAARAATLADISAAEWEILAQLRKRFYTAQLASQRVKLAENQASFGDTVLRLSRRQLEAGEISRTDYRQLEIRSARLKTNLLTARAAFKSAVSNLRVLIGLSPAEKIEITDELAALVDPSHASDVLINEVLEHHPRLRHAEIIAEQRRRELTLEHAEAKPNITGGFFWEQEETHSNKYGINLSFPLPLFNRRQGSIAAAQSALEKAKAEMRAVGHTLRNETKIAVNNYIIGYEAASFYRNEVLPAIQANLEQLENAFRLGEIGLIELRVDQRELIEAQITSLETLSDTYQYRATIEGLLGRGLEASRRRTNNP